MHIHSPNPHNDLMIGSIIVPTKDSRSIGFCYLPEMLVWGAQLNKTEEGHGYSSLFQITHVCRCEKKYLRTIFKGNGPQWY